MSALLVEKKVLIYLKSLLGKKLYNIQLNIPCKKLPNDNGGKEQLFIIVEEKTFVHEVHDNLLRPYLWKNVDIRNFF